jgi:uncharacterized protein (UPF0335 family)
MTAIAADRLKSFIERIEKLMEERHAIGGDIRDVFSEAKSVGYDVKTMRGLIRLRAMDAADRAEQEALLDTYAHALGMETDSRIIELQPSEDALIERATKIVREVDQCLTLPRDPLPTIRHIMEAIGCSSGKAHKLRRLVEERLEAMAKFSRSNVVTVKSENEKQAEVAESGPGSQPGTPDLTAELPTDAGALQAMADAETTWLALKAGGLAPAQKPSHPDERAEGAV